MICVTALCGTFVDGSVPYYPIEISRTATGSVSWYVFAYGLTACSGVLWWEIRDKLIQQHVGIIITWIGLLLLAWVDDVTSWSVHMLGAALLGVGTTMHVLLYHQREHLVIVACALFLYAARLVLKTAVVMALELRIPLSAWSSLATSSEMRAKLITTSLSIMYDGNVVNPLTLGVFRTTGVMQWLVFALMSTLYM